MEGRRETTGWKTGRTENSAQFREKGMEERENRREGRQEFSSSRKNAHYVHAPLQFHVPLPVPRVPRGSAPRDDLEWARIPNFRWRFFHRAPVVNSTTVDERETYIHTCRAANNGAALFTENRGTFRGELKERLGGEGCWN